VVAFLLGAGSSTSRPADFLRGDADASGDVNVADAFTILAIVWLDEFPSACLGAADADGSDLLGIADAVYLLNFLFDRGSPPPAPYPSPGPPEAGDLPCDRYEPVPTAADKGIVIDIVSKGEYRNDFEFPAMVQLSTQEFGVEAWSLAIAADGENCSIVAATSEGTVVAGFTDAFARVELTSGPGNEGVVSAVIASMRLKDALPPAGSPHDILALRWTPEGFGLRKVCYVCSFRIADGLRGSGEPMVTRVVRGGSGVIPTTGALWVDSCFFLPPPPTAGDCNFDEAVDIADPVFLLSFLFGDGTPPLDPRLCDADRDGGLNITDAVRVLNFLFRGGPPLPPIQ
jgi:hypothetical protein